MTRRLAELDPLDVGVRRSSRSALGERVRSAVVVLGAVGLLAVAWQVNGPAGSYPTAFGGSEDVDLPPTGFVDRWLEHPEEVVTDDGTYRFRLVRTDDGSPVTYDSCAPVSLVVNPDGAPDGSTGLVEEAAAEVEDASGLTLDIAGATDERPQENRPVAMARYGPGWAPSLVAWSDPDETPRLSGDAAGLGGSTYVRRGSEIAYVSGSVTLDGPQLAERLAAGDRDRTRAILVHELAHLVGLQHVSDPDELMYPLSQPGVESLQDGDMAGLAALGEGGCTDW